MTRKRSRKQVHFEKRTVAVSRPRKKRDVDHIALATAQHFTHQHSLAVKAQRDLVLFEHRQVQERIQGLTSALTSARRQLKGLDAQLAGLERVMECRQVVEVDA